MQLLVLLLLVFLPCFAQNPNEGLVRHFLTFRFWPNVTKDEKAYVMQYYTSLKTKCVNASGDPYIVSFDAGFPNSPEGQDHKMEQGYIVSFKNVADRDFFVGRPFHFPYDPYHDAFKAFVGPLLLKPIELGLFVFDMTVLP